MKKYKLIIFTLFLTVMMGLWANYTSTVLSQDSGGPPGKKWALIIGLNEYMKGIKPLNCAVNDARTVKSALIQLAGFQEENVFLLTTDQRDKNSPTNENITYWLRKIRKEAGKNDLIFFFFSGHGIQLGGTAYLVTFEADPTDDMTLEDTCLEFAKLGKWLERLPTNKRIICVDACRDDPRTGFNNSKQLLAFNGLPSNFTDIADSNTIMVSQNDNLLQEPTAKSLTLKAPAGGSGPSFSATFFSCQVGQRSFEWDDKGLGFFTFYLVKGLEGEALDKEDKVTVERLKEYVCPNVCDAVEKVYKKKQSPLVEIDPTNAGKVILSSKSDRKVSTVIKPFAGGSSSVAMAKGSSKSLEKIPRKSNKKIKYTLDIIANDVEGRDYDQLLHRLVHNVYTIDKKAVYDGLAKILNETGEFELTENGDEADIWIFFNILPTKLMTVDMMVRYPEKGAYILKENREFNRPSPGKQKQLVDVSLSTFKREYLKEIKDLVE